MECGLVRVESGLDQPSALRFVQLIVVLVKFTIFHAGESLSCHLFVTVSLSLDRPAAARRIGLPGLFVHATILLLRSSSPTVRVARVSSRPVILFL